CTVVLPALKAASSSTRFEMLLEPGRATVPAAVCSDGMSRNSAANIYLFAGFAGRHAPMGPRLAGLLDLMLQRLGVAAGDLRFQGLQGMQEDSRLREQLFPVRDHDVAPHERVAGRDPCEVAKPRAG